MPSTPMAYRSATQSGGVKYYDLVIGFTATGNGSVPTTAKVTGVASPVVSPRGIIQYRSEKSSLERRITVPKPEVEALAGGGSQAIQEKYRG